MTLARLVILKPSTVTLSPSYVILNTFASLSVNSVKNLRTGSAKSLRTGSVKDLWQNDPLPGGPTVGILRPIVLYSADTATLESPS